MKSIYKRIACRLQRRSRLRSEEFAYGARFGSAVMADCFRVVLSDPEVMGKDIFGNARKDRVVNAAYRHYDAMRNKRMEETKRV